MTPGALRVKEECTMEKSSVCGAARLLILAACLVCSGAQPKEDDREDASTWMQKKLEYSQKILAGLTKGDFDSIKRSANNMSFLGYLEKASMAGTPGYKRQVTYFEFANQQLIQQAEDRNLQGTTLAFTQLTLSCVQCHQLVRDVKK
jgi:hypothetical protein